MEKATCGRLVSAAALVGLRAPPSGKLAVGQGFSLVPTGPGLPLPSAACSSPVQPHRDIRLISQGRYVLQNEVPGAVHHALVGRIRCTHRRACRGLRSIPVSNSPAGVTCCTIARRAPVRSELAPLGRAASAAGDGFGPALAPDLPLLCACFAAMT